MCIIKGLKETTIVMGGSVLLSFASIVSRKDQLLLGNMQNVQTMKFQLNVYTKLLDEGAQ